MAKRNSLCIGPRDLELLQALDALVLTSAQILKFSQTFAVPFPDTTTIRRRLRKLQAARLVRSFPYAFAARGQSPSYWKLTQQGFRMLYGDDIELPRRRTFEAIAPGHHYHTQCLSDLVIHLLVLAQNDGVTFQYLTREGSVKIENASFTLYPDFGLQLVSPVGKPFNFLIELDNGTERVRSKQAVESLERKIRGYDAHQSQFEAFSADRYVVLFVTTRSGVRVNHINDAIEAVTSNRQRRMFLTADLQSVLKMTSLTEPAFHDLNGPTSVMILP
jgi:hypothetical protein